MKGAEEIRGKDTMDVSSFELPEDGEHAVMVGNDVKLYVNEETKAKSLWIPFEIHGGAQDGVTFSQFFSLNGKGFSNKMLVYLMHFSQLLPEIEKQFPADIEPNDERVINTIISRISGRKLYITTKKTKGKKEGYDNVQITNWRMAAGISGDTTGQAPVAQAPANTTAPGAPAPAQQAGW